MLIRFTKTRDGFALTCTRPDGSVTTAKPSPGQFFILHDLMHYCVETTLGFTKAFYGSVAEGRSIQSFNKSGILKELDDQATQAEFIIGTLQTRQRWSAPFDADEINADIIRAFENDRHGRPAPPPLTQQQVDTIVRRHDEYVTAFTNLNVGEYLELTFP